MSDQHRNAGLCSSQPTFQVYQQEAPLWNGPAPLHRASTRSAWPSTPPSLSPPIVSLQALVVVADVAPSQLSPFSPALAAQLLQEGAEGRLWEGKEGLLTALGALAAACTPTLVQQPGENGSVAPNTHLGQGAASASTSPDHCTDHRHALLVAYAALFMVLGSLCVLGSQASTPWREAGRDSCAS